MFEGCTALLGLKQCCKKSLWTPHQNNVVNKFFHDIKKTKQKIEIKQSKSYLLFTQIIYQNTHDPKVQASAEVKWLFVFSPKVWPKLVLPIAVANFCSCSRVFVTARKYDKLGFLVPTESVDEGY